MVDLVKRAKTFLRNVASRRGYSLIEASTVVAITGVMAIVTVPIASEKIEESKTSTAASTTVAVATAMAKFIGDASIFPIAKDSNSFENGHLKPGHGSDTIDNDGDGLTDELDEQGTGSNFAVKVLRSGLGETNNNLDPDLNSVDPSPNLSLWDPVASSTVKANAESNINDHVVTDTIGYGRANLTWLGPYIPAIDQDPWGRNYLAYVNALNFNNFKSVVGSGITLVAQANGNRVYGWIISSGPDERVQTAPTDSIIKGDDIGTLLAVPAVVPGTSSKK